MSNRQEVGVATGPEYPMKSQELIVAELRLKRLERNFEELNRELSEVMPLLTAREQLGNGQKPEPRGAPTEIG